MAVSSSSAKKVTAPATLGREGDAGVDPILAGTYPFEVGDDVVTGWHFHELHQLEYAFEGTAQVETAAARYLLPPQQAIWIPAGVEHCTTLSKVRTLSVFFHPSMGLDAGEHVRVIPVEPVVREMILHAGRWPITRTTSDPVIDVYFETLGRLITDELEHESPLRLPTSEHELVAAAMAYTQEHLSEVTESSLCAAVGTSERSLRRAFMAEAKMSWRRYLLESRLLRAMALLAQPDGTVLSISLEVGFESTSGFTRAFRRHTGETPHAYRRRVRPARALSASGPR